MYRRLHGKQGHDLQQMVLDDISDDAVLIKVAASAFCAKVFAEDDLYVPDEAAAPQGLEYQVGKSQDLQDVTCQVCVLLSVEGVLPPRLDDYFNHASDACAVRVLQAVSYIAGYLPLNKRDSPKCAR